MRVIEPLFELGGAMFHYLQDGTLPDAEYEIMEYFTFRIALLIIGALLYLNSCMLKFYKRLTLPPILLKRKCMTVVFGVME